MTTKIEEHNKKYAEASGCYVGKDGGLSDVPIEWSETHNVTFFHVSDLNFHDSYDWAMLLVAKVLEDVEMTAKLLNKYLWDLGRFLTLTPQQLSQSCLEVLD